MILAAERAFPRVIGVEVRASLVDICQRNLGVFSARDPQRRAPVVVWGDAAEIALPPGCLVLYLYNPFPVGVLRAILTRERGEVWIAYVHPLDERVVKDAGFCEVARGTTDPAWVLLRRPG